MDESKNRSVTIAATMVLLLCFSGCIASPFNSPSPQESSISIYLNNSANTTHTFDVYVVDGPLSEREIAIQRGNGETEYISSSEGITLRKFSEVDGGARSVKPPANHSRLYDQYSLSPTEEIHTNITDTDQSDTVVVAVSNQTRVVSLVSVDCDGRVRGVEVAMIGTGTDAGYDCW